MKYYEKCSLGDSLSAFFSESHGPVAVVIYIGDEEARKDFFDELNLFEKIGDLSIHGDNVEWINSNFNNLQGFMINYGQFIKGYFKEERHVVIVLEHGFDAFDNKPDWKTYLFDRLKNWGADGVLEIIVEAEQTFLTTVV